MKQISTSVSSFEEYIKGGSVYVDKTQYVWDLVHSTDKAFFLSRPRRFGKSMFLSTLEAYFQGKRELFQGLRLEALAPGEWEQWPVVHLDMSKLASRNGVEPLTRGLVNLMQNTALECGLTLEPDYPNLMFEDLIYKLHAKAGKQVVVLVDEYDKPILDALSTPHAEEVLKAVHDFYIVLKSCNNLLRFVFVTGVSKFAHTSLFSGMNNLQDLTTVDAYATMLGYTQQELRDNFADYIAAAAAKHNISESELVELMKDWYDGFRFTPDSETLFNPVSVGKFFGEYKFSNYWYETGTPSFLIEQLKNNPIELEQYSEIWFRHDHFSKFSIHDIDPMALAVQTGYLTIKESRDRGNGVQCRYDFPNHEIRQSWSESMLPLMSKNRLWMQGQRNRLDDALIEGDIDKLMAGLQSLIAGLSYENIGKMQEGDYRNLLKIAFTSMGYHAYVEDHNIQGRVDLAVLTRERAYVFELKLMRAGESTEALLEKAIRQARENHYADKYRLDHAYVHTLAVVFDDKTRQLVAWQEV